MQLTSFVTAVDELEDSSKCVEPCVVLSTNSLFHSPGSPRGMNVMNFVFYQKSNPSLLSEDEVDDVLLSGASS